MPANKWKDDFLRRLNKLPAEGYERFTSSFLKAEGFRDVSVERRRDGNLVDGSGTYRAPLFGFRMLFLSVRNLRVNASHVRRMDGAIQTLGDRGLLITTGAIGKNVRELCRDKANSYIDIVDGPLLCESCRSNRLGLSVIARTIEKVDIDLRDFELPAEKFKFDPNDSAHKTYGKAWQYMADRMYEKNKRDLCKDIRDGNLLGRPKLIEKSSEDLNSGSRNRYVTVSIETEPKPTKWFIAARYGDVAKRGILRSVADHFGFSFGEGKQIDVGF